MGVGVRGVNIAPPLRVFGDRGQFDTAGPNELGSVCIGSVKVQGEAKWYVVVVPSHVPIIVEISDTCRAKTARKDGVDAGASRSRHALVDFGSTKGWLSTATPFSG